MLAAGSEVALRLLSFTFYLIVLLPSAFWSVRKDPVDIKGSCEYNLEWVLEAQPLLRIVNFLTPRSAFVENYAQVLEIFYLELLYIFHPPIPSLMLLL